MALLKLNMLKRWSLPCLASTLKFTQSCGPKEKSNLPAQADVATKAQPLDEAFHEHHEGYLGLGSQSSIQDSLLRAFDKAYEMQKAGAITYPFCVAANYPITDSERRRYAQMASDVATNWLKGLQGAKDWYVSSVTFKLVGNAAQCPENDSGLRVYKLMGDVNTTRAYAEVQQYKFVYGLDKFRAFDARTLGHEMGHQFGLPDTYSEAGYQNPQGQDIALMNNYYRQGVVAPIEDDYVGLRHIWDLLTGRTTNTCPKGYEVTTATENRNRNLFCRKSIIFSPSSKAKPQADRGSVLPTGSGSEAPPPVGQVASKPAPKVDPTAVMVYMKSKRTGKCVTANGHRLEMQPCNGALAQKFYWNYDSLENQQTKTCIDVTGNSNVDYTAINLYACNKSDAQKFQHDDKTLMLHKGSRKCIDVASDSRDNGAGLVLWPCHGADNQAFSFDYAGPLTK